MYLVRPSYLLKRLYPSAIWRMNPNQNTIYLTFDDGPVPEITPWVLDELAQHNIKATFFCVGENIIKHPDIYQRILKEKHAIGNHTFNHLNGWNTHTQDYINNIAKCDELMNAPNEKVLFRPPYGKAKKSQLKTLQNSQRYSVIMWDVLSGDYDKKTSPEKCLHNVTNNVRNGSIIVFHDNIKAKDNLQYALPLFIEYARDSGFEFGTL